ncbi:MAG: hypothetical protein KDA68_07785 [Planctomycetaceae bacterium]|nr:hypothetical protein [Planctomycetaceae bacterium]
MRRIKESILHSLPPCFYDLLLLLTLSAIPVLFPSAVSAQHFTRTRSCLWQNVNGHNLAIHPRTGQILVSALDTQARTVIRTYSPDLSASTDRTFGESSGIFVSISSSGKFINVWTAGPKTLDFTMHVFADQISAEKPLLKRKIHDPEFPVSGFSIGDRDDIPTKMFLNLNNRSLTSENLLNRHQTIAQLDDLQIQHFYLASQDTSADTSFFAVGRRTFTQTDPGFDLYRTPSLSKLDLDTQPLGKVSAINFAKHDNTLLIGDETGQIAVWDLHKSEPRRICLIQPSRLLAKHAVRQLALSKSGRYLAGKLDDSLLVWSLPSGRLLTSLDRRNRDWISFAWRDETLVTLAGESQNLQSMDTHIDFWSIDEETKTSSGNSITRPKARSTMPPVMEKYFILLMSVLMILNGVLYFSWPAFRNLGKNDPRVIELYSKLERDFGFDTQLLDPWLVGLVTVIGIALLTASMISRNPPNNHQPNVLHSHIAPAVWACTAAPGRHMERVPRPCKP